MYIFIHIYVYVYIYTYIYIYVCRIVIVEALVTWAIYTQGPFLL